jgi:predicted patatin/cPLA2 family phospholipase
MINTLCISGGGIKGICVLGCIKNLIKNNVISLNNIKNYYCCSIGSIISFLFVLGLSTKDICYIWKKLNLEKYKLKFDFDKFIKNKGIDDAMNIMIILQTVLYKKTNKYDITFMELYKLYDNKLNIVATNITLLKEELFSYDTTPNMSVMVAIRMSISLPIIFSPVLYKNNYYIDGGVINNFPIKYITTKNYIGIITQFYPIDEDINIINIIMRCFNIFQKTSNEKNIKNYNNIILLYYKGNKVNEYNISNKNFDKLYRIGYNITQKWSNKYICKNIINDIISNITLSTLS